MGSPRLQITAPPPGSTVLRGAHTVTVTVDGFRLVDKGGAPPSPGEGHLMYYLDVKAPTEPGRPARTARGTYHARTETSYLWPGISPGRHTISVQVVNNDDTPLEPPVVATVGFVVSEQEYVPPSPTSSG